MISADPTIPEPFFSQAFNRFAYVYDSPLNYTDPSGFWCHNPKNHTEVCQEMDGGGAGYQLDSSGNPVSGGSGGYDNQAVLPIPKIKCTYPKCPVWPPLVPNVCWSCFSPGGDLLPVPDLTTISSGQQNQGVSAGDNSQASNKNSSSKKTPPVPPGYHECANTPVSHGVYNTLPTTAPNRPGAYGVPETLGTAAIDRPQWTPLGGGLSGRGANAYINQYRNQISGYAPDFNGDFIQVFSGVSDNMGPLSGVENLQMRYPGDILFELPGGPNMGNVPGMVYVIPNDEVCPHS